METEVVTIQEPVSTKKNVEEAHAGVDKVNLSTVLDDEITSQDCGNNAILGEADVVNGSGNKETEESEREKGEAMKTISVEEDNKIVKEKASETEKDEQGSIFVHEPESFNKNIEEVSVEKAVIEEDQTDTKVHSPEQEEELIDENDIKKSLNSTHEEIPIKTDDVNEEKGSRSAETSVNETEAEHKAKVSVEEISRNGENIVNETVPEEETATDGESIHDIETTKSVLLEVKKEEEEEEAEVKTDAEPLIKTVLEDVESESLKENQIASDAEQIPSEVTIDKEKEEGITQNREEEQESVSVIETEAIQEEKIESKASSLDYEEEEKDKSSKDTEEHEHVFVRDIPQVETLVTEAESVDTSTVQEAEILKSNVNETEANSAMGGEEEEGQETKENTKPSQDLKEDKEQEETEISSDEVRSSDVQVEEFGEPSSLEIKDESHGREETVEVKTKETIQEEINEKKHENLHDVASLESVKSQDNEPETALVTDTESQEKFEETPSDLAINVDKEELKDEKIKEEQRGIDSNGAEAEQVDENRAYETEEISVAKLVVLPDVEESVEQIQTPSIESASEISEETSKTVNEKIEEKPEEEVTMHQEGQEKGSYGLETKEEIVSVPESIELGEKPLEEKSVIDINPLQEEESSVPNGQEKETKLETHEPRYEEVKADEVLEGSSALPSKELEGETVVETEKIESIKENEEEQAGDKIAKSLETVDTAESHSSLPSSLEEEEHGTVSEKIEDDKVKEEESIVESKSEEDATKSHERQEDFSESVEETTVVQAEQTRDIEPFFTEKCSMDESQPEERSADEQKKEVSKDSESIVNETYALHSAEAAEEETATNGESPQQDVEITKRVLVEVEKDAEEAEMKTDAEPIEKEEIETLKTVAEEEEAKIVNNEDTTAYESTSLKGDDHHDENAELVEEIKNSDDAEQISHEVTVDKEMEEDMTQKTETVQESSKLIETPTTQGEDIESKASPDHEEEIDKISKDTEENEHVLGKDIPQCETLEVEAVEENEDTKPSLDKEDEEQEVTETAKTVIFSDEVRPSDQIDVQVEELSEHIEPCSSEIKDESHGREESVEVKTKEIVQEESTEEKHENRLDVPSTESEKYHLQKPSLESPSEVSEETSKIIDENIEEKSEEETVAVQESKKLGEQAHEERSLIDLTPLQEKETKLEKHELTNEEIKSDEVIEVSSASLSKELEVETVVQAEKIENIKDNEEDQAEDKIQKSVETVEAHSSLPSSLDEKEHGTVSEKIEDEKVNEEEPIVQIKSEDDTTKSHERQEDQTRDIEPSLTEKCSMDQSQPEEQVKEACSRDEQEKEISKNSENTENETYASHSTEAAAEEEESATNGESPLHDVETTKSVLLEVEKEAEMKTEEIESVEDAKIVDNEETAAHESESLQEDTHEEENAEEISREVTVDRETEEDITRKTEKVQESSMVIETPTTQGDGIESKASLELKEEAEQSSKETKEHELVLERDIPQFETLEIEAVDTSTVQEAAILKTLETNTNETEEVHSEIGGAEESQEIKEDTETSMDLKVDKEKKEAETLKTVIFSDEVKLSDQVDAQEEELGEETGTYSSEIKDESQGREESVEVKSKETVQDENIEKCQENEPGTTLVSKIESQEKSEEVLLDLTLKDELKDEKTKADQNMEVLRGLDLNEPEAEQIDQNRTDGTEESPVEKLVAVEDELVEKLQKPSLETSSELSEKTSKTVDEKIEDKPEEEETLHQEDQETKEETVSVPNEKETETKLQEKNEPTNEEVSNDQQSLVEETSDEVIQVSSASPSEGPEDETVVEAEKIVDKKVDEEEQVAEKIQDSLETVEKVEPQSSLQEHGTVSEKTDDEKLKEAEPMGDMSEKGLEIAETTDLSLPSVDQTKDIKAFDEELQISSVAVPLDDEQEKVTSTEKEETKANETAEAKKGDEEITRITSKTSENVCIQQEEFEKIEAPKLEESQKDIAETIKAVEATSDQTLPIETSDAEEKDQTPKEVEEIHEEETKEAYKLQAEEILPTEIIPRESSDEALTSMLASKESEDEVTETKDTQEEQSASVETEESVGETKPKEPEDEHVETPASPIILEKNDTEILIAEANLDEFKNPEALKLEESKEDKSQEILEIAETIEATNNQTELVSRLDDQTPKHVEEIHETSQEHQTSDLASELDDQITKQVEEVHEEETKEEHKLKVAVDQILPVETSEADQTSSLVSEILGEETKETHKIQADETVPREPFSEAERREKSDDQVETSNKLSEVEDEDTKKTDIEVAEHEDENSSNLPVVEILKGLHTTLETEREVNDSASSRENLIIEPADQEQKKGDAVVESNEKDSASDIIEELNLQEEDKEEVKVQDGISRELQEETREISESKEEVPAHLSLTEVLPVVKILTPPSPLPSEEQEHVISEEKQEEREPQQDVNASTSEKENKAETHENVKEEDKIVDIKEEKKNEEEQDEKLWDSSATRDIEEIFSTEVKDDDKEVNSVLRSEEETNEVVISEKQITDPAGVITKAREAEHESNEEHIETQVILDDTKSNDDRDFPTEQALKDQEDEVSADKSLTKEAPVEKIQVPSSSLLDDQDLPSEIIQPHQSPNQAEETSFEFKKTEEEDKNEEAGDALIIKENVQAQDQPKDFEASVTDKESSEQEQQSNDLKEDDEVRCDSHDSVVEPKEETGLIEEKKEVEHVKTELEDAIKHGVLVEEKNNTTEKIERDEATKEIFQEENKQTNTVNEEIREEEKETKQESFKKTDDETDLTKTETRDIESLSSVSKTQDKPEQKDEVPNQRTREIAVEVPKIAEEEVHKKDLLSEVKESEPTEKESARKSLSNLIQKVKGTTKSEDATKEPHIEEEPKTEEEEEESEEGDHEHNKDDKTSPDSIVMVEAKDTVSIIKTHKKSQGILSGVGSKVKHSISKVKKVFTGKSSHTTKPSSPK